MDSRKFVVGIDLGKATASFATGVLNDDGTLSGISTKSVRHLGAPVDHFKDFYKELDHSNVVGIAATGVFSNRLKAPIIAEVPEEIAQEIAAKELNSNGGPINIVRLGASGYSILTIDEEGTIRFDENDKCSSGTGETVEKICGRLGLKLDDAIKSVEGVEESIPISARCSVFAKSEMTHYANQGEPHEKLLLGYFESVARNLFSLYDKFKVPGPVVLIGNGALIGPISDAFIKLSSAETRLSPEASVYEAIGVMYLAAERANGKEVSWPADPDVLIREKTRRIESLEALSGQKGTVTQLKSQAADVPPDSPAILGIDLGSTGSKAVLVDAKTNEVIVDLYRRTDGNPVEAAKALAAGMAEMTGHPIIGIGLTGSGRNAAETVFRAAYPELDSRIHVQNEIVAHATAAKHYDDHDGQSLSIVEIGGQDAKFVNLQGGRIVESDMNRACSAGTGSFLEEQAVFYGLADITKFGTMAEKAKSPPNLGQMCTVFVADLASEALSEGFTLEDLFAGFQYSVIVNYKNRVMGNRQFMDRIFFQGKPASNPSLAQTLAMVTGRDVIVPPNPGAMGAIGIAMLAAEQIENADEAEAFDLRKVIDATIISKKTFRCKDADCSNLCRIETAKVAVEDEEKKIVSGGSCPKYEEATSGHKKLPKEAPNPYREREELLQSHLPSMSLKPGMPRIGIPYGHYIMEFMPLFHTFFTELGFNVEVIRSDKETFDIGNKRCTAPNTCTPAKIMHGLAKTDVDFLFMPKIVDMPRDVKKAGAGTCPITQGTPQLIDKALEAEGSHIKILRPIIKMSDSGLKSRKFVSALKSTHSELARSAGNGRRGLRSFNNAYRKALKRQKSYAKGLIEIGRRAIDFAEEEGYPVVLVVGNTHVIHEPIMNAGIHDIIAKNGAIPLPLDCCPIPDSVPPLRRVYWYTSNRALRASLYAAKKGFIFPALIVSYGCGPSSFLESLFNDLLENYPHTVLESDGHGGQAGYLTRIQAFLHSARSYVHGEKEAVSARRVARYDHYPRHTPKELKSSKISTLSVGPALGRHTATALRANGYDADFSGLTDAEGFSMGRTSCSQKECLPYQLIWGSFAKYLEENPPQDDRKTLLLNVTGYGPCRNGMFPLANEIALRKMGYEDKVEVVTFGSFRHDPSALGGTWFSVVGTDLLNLMRFYTRGAEANPGDSDRLFNKYVDQLDGFLSNFITGRNPFKAMKKSLGEIEKMITEAAKEFAAIPEDPEIVKDIRTVYLSGDIYLRVDEWGNDELVRKLNSHGLRVILEPFSGIFEYFAYNRSRELVEMDTGWFRNRILRMSQDNVIKHLYSAANKVMPWIKPESVKEIEREASSLLDKAPLSEATLTIGNSLLAWRTRPIDGVVVVSPWGCGPALISESQLKRRTDIPMLFVYNDGDPIDEARISGFAWRLKRKQARLAA